jgi:hypothetical protein
LLIAPFINSASFVANSLKSKFSKNPDNVNIATLNLSVNVLPIVAKSVFFIALFRNSAILLPKFFQS